MKLALGEPEAKQDDGVISETGYIGLERPQLGDQLMDDEIKSTSPLKEAMKAVRNYLVAWNYDAAGRDFQVFELGLAPLL